VKQKLYFSARLQLLVVSFLILLPSLAWAQGRDLQWYLAAITGFINNTLIPFFFALAILFLFVNVTRYLIIDGADVSSREQARKYIMYAIIGLVFLTSIWGVINLVTGALRLDNTTICPDYNGFNCTY